MRGSAREKNLFWAGSRTGPTKNRGDVIDEHNKYKLLCLKNRLEEAKKNE